MRHDSRAEKGWFCETWPAEVTFHCGRDTNSNSSRAKSASQIVFPSGATFSTPTNAVGLPGSYSCQMLATSVTRPWRPPRAFGATSYVRSESVSRTTRTMSYSRSINPVDAQGRDGQLVRRITVVSSDAQDGLLHNLRHWVIVLITIALTKLTVEPS